MKDKIKAIFNIITNKPVMMNVTVYTFDDEKPRIYDRLHHVYNKDGIIVKNIFIEYLEDE